MSEAALPQDFSYSDDHEWINTPVEDAVGATVRVGITSVATDRLGEVVFAELPEVGDSITAGEPCGEVESTKSVSDLFAPVTGTVTAINEALEDDRDQQRSLRRRLALRSRGHRGRGADRRRRLRRGQRPLSPRPRKGPPLPLPLPLACPPRRPSPHQMAPRGGQETHEACSTWRQ